MDRCGAPAWAPHFGRTAALISLHQSEMSKVFCAIVIAAISAGAGGVKNVVVTAPVTRMRLPIPVGALQSKTELMLRNIRFDAHPGTQFHIVLERRDDPARRARVGTLSFYMQTKARGAMMRTFDVTDELRQIAPSAADLENIDVVFEATTGAGGADAKPTSDPQSRLTIGTVELRVKTDR